MEIIDEFEKNPDKLRDIVNRKVDDLYTGRFKRVCKEILVKCRDIRDIEKRRTWLRLRKWLFLNRIMQYSSKTAMLREQRTANFGKRNIYFPDDNSKSFLDDVHPRVKISPFYQLANLFKIKNATPESALKYFATSSESDLLTYFKLDKEKLEELKKELSKDPEKFVDIWYNALNKELDAEFEDAEDKKLLEYDQQYRYYNDGRSIFDQFNFQKYKSAKDYWREYKFNTLQYLRKVTTQLIYQIVNEKEASTSQNSEEKEKHTDSISDESMHFLKELFNVVKDKNVVDLFNSNYAKHDLKKMRF